MLSGERSLPFGLIVLLFISNYMCWTWSRKDGLLCVFDGKNG